MNIDISKLTVTELKALGYDLVIQRTEALRRADELANWLRMVDQQIDAKQSAEASPQPSPSEPAS